MKKALTAGRSFYGISMLVYGVQQLIYGNFRNVQLPAWQTHIPFLPIWAYLTGIALIAAGLAIIAEKKAREVLLCLGGIFLLFFLFVHVPFEMFGEVNSSLHLALWTDALKELALSGGAFVLAGSITNTNDESKLPTPLSLTARLIPLGPIFFSIPMVSFGIMHFLYADFVGTLVPDWFPDHLFWTHLTGVVLIGAGTSIILNIRQGAIAMLFSIVLFLWFALLHIPRGVEQPYDGRGNELSSAFDALAFCGVSLVIAARTLKKDLTDIFE
jgi:uncharacterized membrane protein YphA (DoxX/SURF4 family)